MQIATEFTVIDHHRLDGRRAEVSIQGRLKPFVAKHAIAGTGDGDSNTCRGLSHKHPNQGIARSGLFELGVGRAFGNGKANRGDDLIGFKRGGIEP